MLNKRYKMNTIEVYKIFKLEIIFKKILNYYEKNGERKKKIIQIKIKR